MARALLAGSICLCLIAAIELTAGVSRPDAAGNLAADAAIELQNTIGVVDWVMRGPLPPDGTREKVHRSVLFGESMGSIQLDFHAPRSIAALALQAGNEDSFSVEVSSDGSDWVSLWEIGPEAAQGLRTRRLVLPQPIPSRYLRLRNGASAYSRPATLTAFRVYAEVPHAWPEIPGAATPIPSSYPWLTVSGIATAKLVIGCVGAALLVAALLLGGGSAQQPLTSLPVRLLVAVSLLAALGWWSFLQFTDQQYGRTYRHYSDVHLYYVGSKYFDELGYTDLYRCTMAVDVEDGLQRFHLERFFTRDLHTNELVPTRRILTGSDACTESFSPERWAEFKRDNAWLRSHMPPAAWSKVVGDHGFNGTPAWMVVGASLARAVPLGEASFAALVSLDTILFVLMWLFVWSTFGPVAASAAMIYWGTSLVAGNDFTAGAYLRYDWLFCAVVGVCCLERRRMGVAGFLLVYAAMLRVFPGFLVGGVVLGALVDMVRRRRLSLSAQHRRFAAGALLGLVLLGGLSLMRGGSEAWRGFVANTLMHRETPMFQNMGTQAILHHSDQPELWPKPRLTVQELKSSYVEGGHRLLHTGLALVFLALLAMAMAGEEAWVAAILGLAWMPFVTDVTNYYWTVLLVFALLIPRKPVVGYGFAAMIVAYTVLGASYGIHGLGRYYFGSLALVLFVSWIALLFAWPNLVRGRGAAAGA